MAKTVYLLDGMALAYRAYFAFVRNPLRNSKGEDTSAPFGVANSLLKLYREEKPEYWVCVFDTVEPTFRHDIYPEYKATREKMPEEMVAQMPRVREVIEALGCPIIEVPGYEADDVIATLAAQAADQGFEAVMVTGDKDFMQLVTDRITMYNTKRTAGKDEVERLDPRGVEKKFGVPPHQVIDVLALGGDKSDNIPGVPGVGPKTAVKLIKEFGDLETVLANADNVRGKKLQQNLREHAEQARFSRELVTIKTDAAATFDPQRFAIEGIDTIEARHLFTELEFTSLVRQLANNNSTTGESAQDTAEGMGDYRAVISLKELDQLIAEWRKADRLAVDTETTSLYAVQADLVGIAIIAKGGTGCYIPVGHKETEQNVPIDEVLEKLRGLLERDTPKLIGQNIKYDWLVFKRHGVELGGIVSDPMIASFLLNPSSRGHSLEELARVHLGCEMIPISGLIGTGKKQKSFAEVPVAQATTYAAEDADCTLKVAEILEPRLKPAGLENLYANIEIPLISVLARMEYCGVSVDVPYLKRLSASWKRRLTTLTKKIYEAADEEFNINSTQQLATILFDKLLLKPVRKTARTAQRSTDVSALEKLAKEHPLPQFILDYRELNKLKTTYADALLNLVNPDTGRVHTSFNQTIAATGRLSSSDPNLQNIPVRTPEGQKIRRAFIPKPGGHILVVADYSQIELRLMAHFSGDEALREAFARGEDIHTRTASDIFGIPPEMVDAESRRWAKAANFGIIYGLSAYGLSQQTEMSVAEAKDFIDTYFRRYPGVKSYIEKTIDEARTHGFVTTLMGRRRPLPDLHSNNRQRREFAARVAVNTPLQGTAADIIKKAMIDVAAEMHGKRSMMVLQVHDELVFDTHPDELDWLEQMVREKMERAVSLSVPLTVDIGRGSNWLEAK